jgi:hypothetical protein
MEDERGKGESAVQTGEGFGPEATVADEGAAGADDQGRPGTGRLSGRQAGRAPLCRTSASLRAWFRQPHELMFDPNGWASAVEWDLRSGDRPDGRWIDGRG